MKNLYKKIQMVLAAMHQSCISRIQNHGRFFNAINPNRMFRQLPQEDQEHLKFDPQALCQSPFSRFDFEKQCQLFQEYYRCDNNNSESYPLIFALLYDYESNSTHNIIVSNPDNWQYLKALRNASKNFSSLSYDKRFEVVFQNETICDFLRSIRCLEVTVLNTPLFDYDPILRCSNDAQIRELCILKITLSKMGIELKYSMADASFTIDWIGESIVECGAFWYVKHSPFTDLSPKSRNQWREAERYCRELPEKLYDALERDDAASFMIFFSLSNKKICYSLMKYAATRSKFNIMKELIDKYPEHSLKIIKCKRIIQLIIEYGKCTQPIIEILTLLENKQPGIIKNIIDENGCNLLWYGVFNYIKATKKLEEMEHFLLSCGCDTDNRFNGMTYQHFRDLLIKYKIGE